MGTAAARRGFAWHAKRLPSFLPQPAPAGLSRPLLLPPGRLPLGSAAAPLPLPRQLRALRRHRTGGGKEGGPLPHEEGAAQNRQGSDSRPGKGVSTPLQPRPKQSWPKVPGQLCGSRRATSGARHLASREQKAELLPSWVGWSTCPPSAKGSCRAGRSQASSH